LRFFAAARGAAFFTVFVALRAGFFAAARAFFAGAFFTALRAVALAIVFLPLNVRIISNKKNMSKFVEIVDTDY
jgi:hypothetical protein